MKVKRVYIHYPFCSSYCRYCNFSAGAPPKEEYIQPYFQVLMKEALGYKHYLDRTIDSLYLGGGTPSLMPFTHLEELINFYLPFINDNTEITLEANPETVTIQKAKQWKSLGINRVSLGWQSMENEILKMLNRSGNAEDNKKGFSLLREEGFDNISVDRILSVSGDQEQSFFKAVKEFMPEHISTYQLTIEQRTVLHSWVEAKKYIPLSDEDALIQEERCENYLRNLAYERYEISNYAKNGKIGCHNTGYWDYDYYIGLGAGASGFLPNELWGERYANAFSFKDYIKAPLDKENEILNKETAVKEALMLGVRKRSGINKTAFEKRFSLKWEELFLSAPDPLFFEDTSEALILHHDAIPLTNPAVLSLWGKLKNFS